MAEVVVTLPESRPEDDEDVVWGLSTATALWARGERADAVVWLRRAADAADAAGQEARAGELRMFTVRVEQALEQLTQRKSTPPAAPPRSPLPVPPPDPPSEDRLSSGFEEIEPEPSSSSPEHAAAVPPPVPAHAPPPVPLHAPSPVPVAPAPAQAAVVPRAAVVAMRPKSIRPPDAPVAAPRPPSVAPSGVFRAPPAAAIAAPTAPAAISPAPPAPAAPAATAAPAPAVAPPSVIRPPSTPPPSRAPEPSSYPSARKTTGPRVPILDPWADEPTMPSLRVDPVLHTLQIEGDEVMVQMRRGAARVMEEEDGVITSAAPLDHTLGRARLGTPPARRLTATGEQPPGHIADASTGVAHKGPGAKPPPPPPRHAEKPVADGAAAAHPAVVPVAEPSRPAAQAVTPAAGAPSTPAGPAAAAALASVEPSASPPPAPLSAAAPPSSVAAPAATPAAGSPAAGGPAAGGPAMAATVPSFKLDAGRKAAGIAPAAGAASSPSKPKIPVPSASPLREPPRAETLRSMPAVMPKPRPITISPPGQIPAEPASAVRSSPADGGTSKPAGPVRLSMPSSRPPPSLGATLPNAPAVMGSTIPKPSATPSAVATPAAAAPPSAAASPVVVSPAAASIRLPPQRPAVPPPPPSASALPPPAETTQPPAAPRPPASPLPAPPAVAATVLDPSALDNVEALADVPPETRALLASRARVEVLGADDEVSAFGAALVIEGRASVSATIVDAPVAHASPGTLVPTRGTLAEAVALRVVAGAAGARVALWDAPALEDTLGSCPWVLEELAARADRLQALAGATMGPLGEIEESARDRVLDKLVVCVLRAGEAVDAEGIGAALVGVGSVEVGVAGKPVVVRAGEVLFPRTEAPGGAKAGVHGTILLVGDASFTSELDAGPPSLAKLFAAR